MEGSWDRLRLWAALCPHTGAGFWETVAVWSLNPGDGSLLVPPHTIDP